MPGGTGSSRLRINKIVPRGPLEIHLAALCAILVLSFGALLSILAYVRLQATANEASSALFETTVASATHELVTDKVVLNGALSLVAGSYLARATAPETRLSRVATLIQLLGARPAVTAGFIGYRDGSYLYARRIDSPEARRLERALPGSFYVLRYLDRSSGVLHARQLFLNQRLAVIGTRPDTGDMLDPRTRPWFVAARRHELAITPPIRLLSTGGFGFIFSVPGPTGSVAAVSVGLVDLSTALKASATTPNTRIALVGGDRVFALSLPDVMRAALAHSKNEIPRLSALPTPRLAAALRALPPGATNAAGSVKMRDGTVLLYRSKTIDATGGRAFLLVVVIPEKDLSPIYDAIRNQTILLSVLLLGLALPVTWWIGRLIARPLVELADEADALNQLDFTDRPIPQSAVLEIDELAVAFGTMRTRLARFKAVSETLGLEDDLGAVVGLTLSEIVASVGAETGVAYLPDASGTLRPAVAAGLRETPNASAPATGLAIRAGDAREPLQRRLDGGDSLLGDAFLEMGATSPLRVLALPLLNRNGDLVALVLVARRAHPERPFSESAVSYAQSFAGLAALALETKRYRDDLERYNEAAAHFVPTALLAQMDCTDITAVQLGEYRTRTMTVLSSDIRSFTAISEELGANRTFEFLNLYLRRAAFCIRDAGGFVDLYVGDAIVALFPNEASEAVFAAIDLQSEVRAFNANRPAWFERTLQTGVGIDAGEVLLGTIGEPERYTTATISQVTGRADAIESRTVDYGASILVSDVVARQLDPRRFQLRRLPLELPEDGEDALALFEVCDADDPGEREAKLQSLSRFVAAVAFADAGRFEEAAAAFASIAAEMPADLPAARLRDRFSSMLARAR